MAIIQRNSAAFIQRNSAAFIQRNSVAFFQRNSTAFIQRNSAAFIQRNSAAFIQRNSAAFIQRNSAAFIQRNSAAFIQRNSAAFNSEKLGSIHSEKLSSIYSEKLSGNHSEKLSNVHSEKLGSIHAEKIVFEVRRVVHKRLTPLEIRLKILNRFVLADVENLETKRSAVAAPPGDDAPASPSGTASQKAAGNVQTPQTFTAAASALLRSRAAKLRQVQKIMPQSGTKLYLKQVQKLNLR